MTLKVEGVLGTVDWAHFVMEGRGQASGYSMDPRPEQSVSEGAGQKQRVHSPGLFARYLRGDTSPSEKQLCTMELRVEGSSSRRFHPVYSVLENPSTEWHELFEILAGLAVSLRCRIFDVNGTHGAGMFQLPTTSRRQLDLAVQGDGYALAALLILALNAKGRGEHQLALDVATRAYQCMLFSFASGEFRAIRTALAVRIRQQVLDQIEFEGMVLDTASLDVEAGLARLRALLERNRLVGPSVNEAARRRLFREILADSHPGLLPLITPAQVPAKVGLARRGQYRRVIDMDSLPSGRFQHVRRFGKRARDVLRDGLADYWVDDEDAN